MTFFGVSKGKNVPFFIIESVQAPLGSSAWGSPTD